MLTRKALWPMIMALPLLSSCAVPIHDETFCALVPENEGAVCDNFLTSNRQVLTEAEWLSLQATWNGQGSAVECTTSQALGNLKEEVEKLCSEYPCDSETKKKILNGLEKMEQVR